MTTSQIETGSISGPPKANLGAPQTLHAGRDLTSCAASARPPPGAGGAQQLTLSLFHDDLDDWQSVKPKA